MTWAGVRLAGWGRALAEDAQLARPERVAHLRAVLAETGGVPAIGNLRSYGDAALAGRAVTLRRLDRVLALDTQAGTARVEAGITTGALLRRLAPLGWMPAVLPGTGHATVGGAIAADAHGKNHHGAGSFAQHVDSLLILTPDGPQEVPAGSERFRASAGGLGQTGPILEATLRLAPCPAPRMRRDSRRAPDLAALIEGLAEDAPFSVAWLDATRQEPRGIVETADFAHGAPGPLPPAAAKRPPLPPAARVRAVSQVFNTIYYRRVPGRGRIDLPTLDAFFFPLDALEDWPRLYGKAGFYQVQSVTPPDVLGPMLAAVAAARLPTPLAVLKRLGPGRAGHLSFPQAGYTLALDIAASAEARALIDRLEAMTVEAGGRVYLAKDATLPPHRVPPMYPELDAWRAEVAAADPGRRYVTRLTERLGLR